MALKMKRFVGIVLLGGSLFLCGCSLPARSSWSGEFAVERVHGPLEERDAGLFALNVSLWGKRQLTGLLAIRRKPGSISYTVLDHTGMTLLAGSLETKHPGEPAGILSKTGFGRLFPEIVYRVWQAEPTAMPCSWSGLLHFCVAMDDSGWQKKSGFGPLDLWSATAVGSEESLRYTYRNDWQGLEVNLELLDGGM